MSGARRVALLGAVAAVIWYVCVLVFWAAQPLSDAVPVGIDYTLKQPAYVSAAVDCNRLFSSAATDGSALPALKAQPQGKPPLGYQRQPCSLVHSQARVVFAFDTALVLAVVVIAGWFVFWRPRSLAREQIAAEYHRLGVPVGS